MTMTEPPDPEADPEAGADAPAATGNDRAGDRERRGPRWYERGLVWLVVILVGLVGALVASTVASSSKDDPGPPDQATAYCNQARQLAARGELQLAVGQPTEIVAYQEQLSQFAATANGSIQRDIERIRDALDPVVASAQSATAGDPEALAALVGQLDRATTSVTAEASRVSEYIAKWCGFDVNDPALASTTVPATAPTTAPPVPLTTGG